MINFKLSNDELLNTVRAKASQERRLTVEIIELLQEVCNRDLHLQMGYGSLLKFCVEELKYSESAAYRRLSAVRLVKDVPEAKQALVSGELTLQAASQAQTFLNQERKYMKKTYTSEQKKELVEEIKCKSSRQVEQILAAKSPELPKPEVSRQIHEDMREVRFTIRKDLDNKLEQLKSRYSHKNQNPTMSELLELMADEILQEDAKTSKLKIKTSHSSSEAVVLSDVISAGVVSVYTSSSQHMAKPASLNTATSNPRYISAAKRDYICRRDKNRCVYVDSKTGRTCGSQHLIEIDHIQPVSLNGTNEVANLRLVCRAHNQMLLRELQG